MSDTRNVNVAEKARLRAEVNAKNAAIEANRIALMEQLKIRNWRIAQAAQNAKDKYNNLSTAEAEMGRVVPVMAYAPLRYVDEEEKRWLEEGEERRAYPISAFAL